MIEAIQSSGIEMGRAWVILNKTDWIEFYWRMGRFGWRVVESGGYVFLKRSVL